MSTLQIAAATLAYGLTIFALVFLSTRVRALVALFKSGQADPTRNNEKGARLRHMLV